MEKQMDEFKDSSLEDVRSTASVHDAKSNRGGFQFL